MTDSTSDASMSTLVGNRVRELRKRRDMTVQQLAGEASVSRRMLTQIELGQANPSLATLARIADALNVGFTSLVSEAGPEPLVVSRAETAPVVWTSPRGSQAVLHTSPLEEGGVELWTWTLAGHDDYGAEPDAPGSEEHFFVVSGYFAIETLDAGTQNLGPGDAARLATDRTYAYRNDHDTPCQFVRVVHAR